MRRTIVLCCLGVGCSMEADDGMPGATAAGDGTDSADSTVSTTGDDDGAPSASAASPATNDTSNETTDDPSDGSSGGEETSTTTGVNPDANADFEARCSAPGVLVCRGFDDEEELVPICCEWETGAEADGEESYDHIGIDGQIRTSGDGALRFEIEGQTYANHSGAFRQLIGQEFGPGTDLYIQYRLRITPEFLGLPGSPKFAIFHHSSATCNDVELTHYMADWYEDITHLYTHCGQYAPGGEQDGSQDFQAGDYQCSYGTDYATDPTCLKFATDAWMTFYFHVAVGDWGSPTTHVEAWYAVEGGDYEKWSDDPAFTMYAEGESEPGFDSVYLTTYITGKDNSIDHPTAYAWYDELIVSTEPIAVPQY